MNLGLHDVKISSALDYVSGTSDRAGVTLDMAGYEGVAMVVKMAAITAGAETVVKAQQGALSNGTDMADLVGTGITVADDDDNQIFVIDVNRPAERYVRLYVDKNGATPSAESAIYARYGAGYRPVTNTAADAVTAERHVTPAEGTA
jgi:hypothetical protein